MYNRANLYQNPIKPRLCERYRITPVEPVQSLTCDGAARCCSAIFETGKYWTAARDAMRNPEYKKNMERVSIRTEYWILFKWLSFIIQDNSKLYYLNSGFVGNSLKMRVAASVGLFMPSCAVAMFTVVDPRHSSSSLNCARRRTCKLPCKCNILLNTFKIRLKYKTDPKANHVSRKNARNPSISPLTCLVNF